jgi:hypothetical protein
VRGRAGGAEELGCLPFLLWQQELNVPLFSSAVVRTKAFSSRIRTGLARNPDEAWASRPKTSTPRADCSKAGGEKRQFGHVSEASARILWGGAWYRRLTRLVQAPFASEDRDIPNPAGPLREPAECIFSSPKTVARGGSGTGRIMGKEARSVLEPACPPFALVLGGSSRPFLDFCVAMRCANSTLHPAVHEAWRTEEPRQPFGISAPPGSTLHRSLSPS